LPALGDPRPLPSLSMTDDEWHGLAATARPEEALQIPTAIDEKDLANARLDDRWREFCLHAERYVVETTRRRPSEKRPD